MEQRGEILRRVAAGGVTQTAVAREFGVSSQWVSNLVNPRNQSYLPDLPHGDYTRHDPLVERRARLELRERINSNQVGRACDRFLRDRGMQGRRWA